MEQIEDMTNGLLFEEALYVAARQINIYCNERTHCEGCVFDDAKEECCRLGNPSEWVLPVKRYGEE